MKKIILLGGLFLFSAYIGYRSNAKKNNVHKLDSSLIRKKDTPTIEKKILSVGLVSSVKEITSQALTEEHILLRDKLGENSVAKNIFLAVLAINVEDKIKGASQVKEEAYKEAKLNSKESLDHIKGAIRSLGANSNSVTKMRLIDIASSLVGVNEELIKLGEEVLLENIVPKRPEINDAVTEEQINLAKSTTFEMFVPLMGHILAMSKIVDPEEALELSLNGIFSQPEPFVYERIADSHLQKYPEHKDEIYRALSSVNTTEVVDQDDRVETLDDLPLGEHTHQQTENDLYIKGEE